MCRGLASHLRLNCLLLVETVGTVDFSYVNELQRLTKYYDRNLAQRNNQRALDYKSIFEAWLKSKLEVTLVLC